MLGCCVFVRGQPKRAERHVMRPTWLGSCSRRRPGRFSGGIRPWALPRSRCPGLPRMAGELVHLTRTCTLLRGRLGRKPAASPPVWGDVL